MHRFASHVCQTMFIVAKDTVSREVGPTRFYANLVAHCILFSKMRGRLSEVQENSEHGELRTMTQLILDICEVVIPIHHPRCALTTTFCYRNSSRRLAVSSQIRLRHMLSEACSCCCLQLFPQAIFPPSYPPFALRKARNGKTSK